VGQAVPTFAAMEAARSRARMLVDLWESKTYRSNGAQLGATTIDVSLDNQTSVDQQITKAMGDWRAWIQG